MRKISVLLLCLGLAGCAYNGIVRISPDTYMVSKTGGAYSNTAALKTYVFQKANEFAASQGKIIIPLAVSEKPFVPFASYPSVELQFRVVNENAPEAKPTHLIKSPDTLIKVDDSIKADINVRTEEESNKSPDLYTELTKIEDLRKKKILTEEEFQTQKKLILEKQK